MEFSIAQKSEDDMPEPSYKEGCPPDRAVVARDATGELVVVLEYIGPGLSMIERHEPVANAFKRDDPPPGEGIWMWEGFLRTEELPNGETDWYLEGKYRSLTKEEARQSMSGDSPWDPDLWYEWAKS